MFKNLIVGVDGREGGRDAIALAKQLAAPDAAITLAHIYGSDWLLAPAIAARTPFEREEAERLLFGEKEAAAIDAKLEPASYGSPGHGLHELAEQLGADLLLIGSSRRGLLGRVLIGDDTRASLNGAPCAVAIAPAGYSEGPAVMREIGVAYNGSPESEHALAVARVLAAEHHTKLSAFQAVFVPVRLYAAPGWLDPGSIDKAVDAARERVAALGDVEPHAAYGLPAEELTLYSASLDLLVIGSRSYGPIGRLVHGSTAQQLARTARCPLLVLTRAARNASLGLAGDETVLERVAH